VIHERRRWRRLVPGNAGKFQRVRRVRSVLHFIRDRIPHYGPLITDDLHRFREEIVKATVGASVAAAAGLIFACFLSVAVIVSTWDSGHRNLVAWLVCVVWAGLALGGLAYARRAVVGPLPFRLVSAAVSRDYAHLLAALDDENAGGSSRKS
jgi:hypothetical protein